MTVGYTGMAFRGCKSLEEAQAAWLNGPSHTPPCWPPPVRDPITTHPELYPPATNDTTAAINDTQATVRTSSPPPSPAALQASSPPSSPASLASTATFVSAQSAPSSPQPLKFQVPRAALNHDTTVSSLSSPVTRRPRSHSPSHILAASPVPSCSQDPVRSPRSLIDTPRTATNTIASTTTSSIVVSEGRAYAVTVGDVPGVYLDKRTAFLNAGAHPGRVVRPFPTYEGAERFYAKEEGAGRVGFPCFEKDLRS
ncbi:hypothetical protein OH76DRAFT_1490727 [Lentinus brumalis]|uniref:Uncharacterized protein n=1 Tax=Lentinus brumalis TaxID=2498619 RepID=A0A371CI38_9APHY|nr:hypothetical protein OH76DRAFT_1490727 [Polyporus brumalis]